MTYELSETASAIRVTVTGQNREELFRDVVRAVLEAAYAGTPPEGDREGQVVPVQAAGMNETELIAELVRDCLLAVADTPGTLHPPRWISFDERRFTATLGLTSPRTASRALALDARALPTVPASGSASAFSASFELQFAHP